MKALVRFAAVALAASFFVHPAAARAASGTMPTCSAGDPVVWENTHSKSKTYHLQGDKYFGNTKSGAYACKSAADAAGYRASGSKHAASSASTSSDASAPAAGASAPATHKHHHHRRSSASPAPSPAAT